MPTTTSTDLLQALGKTSSMRYKSNIRSIEHSFDAVPRSMTMSAVTLEHDMSASPTLRRPVAAPPRQRTRPDRPSRGTGRQTGPQARPGQVVDAPTLHRPTAARVQGCRAEAAVAAPAAWRLTNRGIAVILTAAVMITFAALTVIGLTALRVTSPTYQAYGHSQLVQP
jgi:hypothetical protein